jgi:hypothetical protein
VEEARGGGQIGRMTLGGSRSFSRAGRERISRESIRRRLEEGQKGETAGAVCRSEGVRMEAAADRLPVEVEGEIATGEGIRIVHLTNGSSRSRRRSRSSLAIEEEGGNRHRLQQFNNPPSSPDLESTIPRLPLHLHPTSHPMPTTPTIVPSRRNPPTTAEEVIRVSASLPSLPPRRPRAGTAGAAVARGEIKRDGRGRGERRRMRRQGGGRMEGAGGIGWTVPIGEVGEGGMEVEVGSIEEGIRDVWKAGGSDG